MQTKQIRDDEGIWKQIEEYFNDLSKASFSHSICPGCIKKLYPEFSETSNFSNTIDGVELRGMFEFKGRYRYSTGGAFWSFHFVHPKTEKIVCVSGYVDAPSTTSWTHAIREIQAIWKSVTIV